jgi:lipid A 3-O-deacylase
MRRVSAVFPVMVAAACVACIPWAVPAQTSWRPRVQLDNDAYDFWLRPGRRSDEQYTNGVKLSLELAGAPWWGRRFAGGHRGCGEHPAGSDGCLSTTLTLGQDIYTPRLTRTPYTLPNWRDERPYFAWLYLSGEAHLASARTLRTLVLALGLTGPPALGEFAQRTAHAVTRRYTSPATGWDTQIGFEPGLVATYRESILPWRVAGNRRLGFDVAPTIDASLGNVLTAFGAGGLARVGWNLSHPWDPDAWTHRAPVEVWASLGGEGSWVARDMSLDGTLVHPNRYVSRTPGVGQYEFGLGARIRNLTLAYRAVTRSREYRTGPSHHAFSSLVLEVGNRGTRGL